MTNVPQFARIGIVDWQENGAAIETLAISEGVCVLSGAWFIGLENLELIADILSYRLLIEIGAPRPGKFNFDEETISVQTATFLQDAKNESELALIDYLAYKEQDPKKRKNLVEPNFTSWPDVIDLNQAALHFEKVGKISSIQGTDPVMEKVLTAARLSKWMIDGWLHDEQERSERTYLNSSNLGARVLPPSWLKVMPSRG